jgi:cobalt/nickel transport system permease protein
MRLEQFSLGSSPLHRLDTRVKIICGSVLVLVLALCKTFPPPMVGLLLGITLVGLARLPFRLVLARLLMVNGFVAFLWLTLPLTYPGESLFQASPFPISSQGVLLASLITVKANGIVLLILALIGTSTIADIGHGLGKLGLPAKLCLLLLFSYRYIFVISEEHQRLVRAAKLRGFQASTNMHTLRTTGYLFGMTLMKSWQRAERVRQAMLLRGFSGKFPSLNNTTVKGGEILFLVFSMTAAAIIIILELQPVILI